MSERKFATSLRKFLFSWRRSVGATSDTLGVSRMEGLFAPFLGRAADADEPVPDASPAEEPADPGRSLLAKWPGVEGEGGVLIISPGPPCGGERPPSMGRWRWKSRGEQPPRLRR